MLNLNIWILVTILTCTNGYDRKCPHSSQWNFTSSSYGCSDQNIYICLFDAIESNGSKTVFSQKCGPHDISREGFRYILTPDLHQVPCTASRYQPFTFKTKGNSQCVFSKSLCNASGQVLANNASSSIDISCRCDYRRNYDYIISPKNPCSCKPAEEDCSCYIRKCDDDKLMIADYRCMKRVETILPEDIKCPIINRIIPPEETDAVYNIHLQPVTGLRTWSKQGSVILIVVVIIYTVLIGFLFFSVPHVKRILLKSKLELKRIENDYMVLNEDSVIIECNVKSYLPVYSVTWQKERNGEIIQITSLKEKYEIVNGKKPYILKINHFNSDDEGKYRCIVRNVIGLRNEMFGSCMNYMSRLGCLTRFVTVLQHIPAFHTEDMTFHTYNISPQSTTTKYNVYMGYDVTMIQFCDNQHTLIAVKWYKMYEESDKSTELNLSNEQYSGGVPAVPALTIKNTVLENAGRYFCILLYDNGETQTSLFKLKIIPKVKIYNALLEHRADKTFVRPAICDTINKQLQENNIVVITGREGTGKSKICLELASFYKENDYLIVKVDLSENYTIYTDIAKALLIIDDENYTKDSLNDFMEHYSQVLVKGNIKVILTCRNLNLDIVRSVLEINHLKCEAFVDINSCLTAKEKEKMLYQYMKVYNITTSASNESNFKDPKILTDLSLQVVLHEDAIKEIKNEEPWRGFPLCASLFCSDRKCLHLGEKYFTNPPRYLFEELRELYKTAKKKSYCTDKLNEYCVLVYIMMSSSHQLDLCDQNLCTQFVGLYRTLFQFNYIPEKPGSNANQIKAIKEALHRMNNKYIQFQEGMYKFIHPCLSKAMFLSSDYMVDYLLQIGSMQDITEFVRSEDYTGLKNELVIRIGQNCHHNLCERLVNLAFENKPTLKQVAQYINKYWHSSENKKELLVNEIFCQIGNTLFESLGVDTGDFQALDNEISSIDSTKVENRVEFHKIIVMVKELTNEGSNPWIYGSGTHDFLILSGLVTAAMGKYAINRTQTFDVLLQEFKNRKHSKSFVKLWSIPLDIHGNTFFHYLMLFGEKEACQILSVHDGGKHIFDKENVKNYSAVDIAAYLGKRQVLEALNIKINRIKELRDRLRRVAISGRDKYFDKSQKKIKSELGFIDKYMYTVDVGEKEDYNSTIKLLSK